MVLTTDRSYLVHSSFAIMYPLHLLYLMLFSRHELRPLWAGLRHALKQHVIPMRFDHTPAFPIWGFARLVVILTIAMAIPALLWFIAVTYAP